MVNNPKSLKNRYKGSGNPYWKGGCPKCLSCKIEIGYSSKKRGQKLCISCKKLETQKIRHKKCSICSSNFFSRRKGAHLCSPHCVGRFATGKSLPTKGRRHSQDTILKLRLSHLGQVSWNKGLKGFMAGENNANWKGGITPLVRFLRNCFEYKLWRRDVFVRDDFTCQFCLKRGGILNADHIKPFSVIMSENKITSYEQAVSCKELWNIDNGRTLCTECHLLTDTFGVKVKNYAKCS